MPVVYPSIEIRSSLSVMMRMRMLKAKRYNHEISRLAFLRQWGELREELNQTPEYDRLRKYVYARSGGVCEKCHEVPGNQMCHKVAVSLRPDLALRAENVYLGCNSCHQQDHPELKLTR